MNFKEKLSSISDGKKDIVILPESGIHHKIDDIEKIIAQNEARLQKVEQNGNNNKYEWLEVVNDVLRSVVYLSEHEDSFTYIENKNIYELLPKTALREMYDTDKPLFLSITNTGWNVTENQEEATPLTNSEFNKLISIGLLGVETFGPVEH